MDKNDRVDGANSTTGGSNPAEPAATPATTRAQLTGDYAATPEANPSASDSSADTSTRVSTERLAVEPRSENVDVAPKPAMMEETTIDVEVEPATEAVVPEQNTSTDPNATTPETSQPVASIKPYEPVVAPTVAPTARMADKQRLVIIAAASIFMLALIGALAWWFLFGGSENSASRSTDTSSAPINQPKLGVAITIADGTVEYMRGETEWQTADANTELQEGDSVRTGTDSRAVLTFDDGSAVRLDASTTIKLKSLSTGDMIIEQIEGAIYSRVVPSDRQYTVAVEGTTYQALGTAFVTINKESEKGIQVYQSSVKASDSADAITEGNQYFKLNSDTNLQGKVTTIDIDGLVDNSFVNWNLTEDENDTNFKTELGVLSRVKERSETLALERQTESARIAQAEKDAIEKARLEAEERKRRENAASTTTRGTMVLSLSGKTLNWTYTGKANSGYKLVYSKETTTPTFGKNDSIYYDSIDMRSATPKLGSGDFYVRVCAYTPENESDKCVDYSNFVTLEL